MSSGLARINDGATMAASFNPTPEQRQMIRDAFANGASDSEFAVLMEIARARQLNPLLRQIHFVKRWNNDLRRETWSAQVAIDGLRAIAQRTGLYAGQDEPEFVEGADNGYPVLCKVRVYRTDWQRPAVGVAYWREYVQTTKDGAVTKMWRQFPHVMLAKVAESVALRKAFPEDIGGLYSDAEMSQAEHPAEDERPSRPAIVAQPTPLQLPSDNGRGPKTATPATAPEDAAPAVDPPAPSDALKAAVEQVVAARDLSGVALACVAAGGELSNADAATLWKAARDRAAELGADAKKLKAAIARLTPKTPPDGPTGGGSPRPDAPHADAASAEAPAANDATGAAAWQSSEAATVAHVRAIDNVAHLEASARHHGAALGPKAWGVRVYAERLAALEPANAGSAEAIVSAWMARGPKVRSIAAAPKRVAA